MKYISFSLIILIGISITFSACEKNFLEMPLSNTTTVDSVFSTATKAQGAIVNAYRNVLKQGLPAGNAWNSMIQANLSGELSYGQPWTVSKDIVLTGMVATGSDEDMDGYASNFPPIRQAFNVIENIDKVTDMSAAEKAGVKAEMKALIAYRYEQMMIIYGGVPIVSRTYEPAEDLSVPRSSVKAVLDSIVSWCDEAVVSLPSVWEDKWKGRMTKAAALAIKSKALLYAARPLFNTATPYLNAGENNDLISLGGFDANRWNTAAAAAEAVITEAEGPGGAYIIENMDTPLDNYGTATSTPNNAEVLLAYKFVNTNGDWSGWNSWVMNAFYNPRFHNEATANVLTSSFARNYYTQTGTDQVFPGIDEIKPFSDYTTRMSQMEPRFKASFMAYEMSAWNNPGDNNWINTNVGVGPGYGVARSVKFYYKAGGRHWFEFPIFRLAAPYLSAAEAYNEMGQPTQALNRLNKIHVRAGLPAITETDQVKLRAIIHREWAVEFFDENYRLHDVKHWKLPNIGNGIIGGPITAFRYNNNGNVKSTGNANYNDKVIYQAFWSPRMYLNHFPQTEVNKGIVVQNPGY